MTGDTSELRGICKKELNAIWSVERENSKREKNITQERFSEENEEETQPAERGSHAGCSIQKKGSMEMYRQPKDASATGKISKNGIRESDCLWYIYNIIFREKCI